MVAYQFHVLLSLELPPNNPHTDGCSGAWAAHAHSLNMITKCIHILQGHNSIKNHAP